MTDLSFYLCLDEAADQSDAESEESLFVAETDNSDDDDEDDGDGSDNSEGNSDDDDDLLFELSDMSNL